MRSASIVLVSYMLLGSSVVRAQELTDLPDDYAAPTAPPPDLAQPTDAPPTQPPPAPPLLPPPSPAQAEEQYLAGQPYDDSAAADTQGPSDGQWVYTAQYGWVFMPYADQYVDAGDAYAETPYAFVYYPGNAWTWVAAPWVWGWEAYPCFGPLGPNRFTWFRGLDVARHGWGGHRGAGHRPRVVRLGSNGYLGGSNQSFAPAPSLGPFEAGYAEPRPTGFSGGFFRKYPPGGYARGNGLPGGGASRDTPWPQTPSGGPGGLRGRGHGSSAAGDVGGGRNGALGGGPAGGNRSPGPVDGVAGAGRGSISAHYGGLGSSMRGGSSGGGRGTDERGRRR